MQAALGLTKTFGAERRIKGVDLVFRDQHVGPPVTGEIDELKIGLRPVQARQRGKGLQRIPVRIPSARKITVGWAGKRNQVKLACSGRVQELQLFLPAKRRRNRLGRKGLSMTRP